MSNVANGAGSLSSSASNGLASRLPHSRNGSHSIIGAALNSGHRVGRRKSMTSPGATNVAAMAAMIQEADVLPNGALAINARRNTLSKPGANAVSSSLGGFSRGSSMAAAMAAGNKGLMGSLPLPSPPASLPSRKFLTADGSAIDDDEVDMSESEIDSASLLRRTSDGQPLKEGRRSSRIELRCEKCGKGYKHSSCLSKHLWEHTPEWALTSKLLISKHQQVQLLEAASVLVTMTNTADADDNAAVTPPDSTRDSASEKDPASPSASGFSYQHDGRSSVDTTPPPVQMEGGMNIDGVKRESLSSYPSPQQAPTLSHMSFSQRFEQPGGVANVARSYQSGLPARNGDTGLGFGHQHQVSRDNLRPLSSGKNVTGQEDNELAAAVELLSCSVNSGAGNANTVTPGSMQGSGQVVPPVPPVPAQYLGQSATPLGDTSFINSFPSRAPESFTRGDYRRSSIVDDVKMNGSGDSVMGDDEDTRSHARSDDDDDGVFGMEA
ncbi:hypothetical protein HMPREF1624_02015 [Sporothrix schenckii ATCC 58251]|uniref:C2H2-type domain-containing protein n=1 Tax=Sporothrix schenckii (strain ATCC 58251 / de Perez 2211183) TaxID=1391915 RepID=U7Q0R1_SPOS1|nr:hypothetical protein HMPREF1624_02015 [Sporothrix schenckii ATCC 58251]